MMSTPWKKWTAALTVALFLVLTVMPAWAATATLRQGSRGQAVTELQQDLNTLGYAAGKADGIYGANTANAVKAFQRDNGLSVDGVAGPATQSAIDLKLRAGGSASGSGSGNSGTITAGVNVRAEAKSGSTILGTLSKGTKVTVLDISGSWVHVQSGSLTGYVFEDYIDIDKAQDGGASGPVVSEESFTGVVKVSGSLNVRKGPGTTYAVVGKLRNGDKVTVTGSTDGWYAISYDGGTGYVSSAYITKSDGSETTSTPGGDEDAEGYVIASALNVRSGPGTNYNILGKLYSGDLVEILGSSNGWYKIVYDSGEGYVSAEYVQKGAPPDDIPPSTNDMLNKDLDIDTTLKVGSTGSKVKDLQTALNIQGFYSGAIDGVYDSAVQSAVKAFQKAAGLDADGIAGNYTLATVYTLLDPIPKSQLNLKAYDDGSSIPIIKPSWSEANNLLPRRATFTIVDVRTGYTFRATRTGGSQHADTEPATRVDTNIMFQAIGSKWSWARRPIWVVYNGVRMAASMNCQPHGFETIGGNDMTGQFCIHFVGSKTHGSNKVDPDHQRCINEAYRAGQ